MNNLVSQMQTERELSRAYPLNQEEQRTFVKDKFNSRLPDNWEQTPLPRAEFIRVKATGEIWPWSEDFANRPDLCDCCDKDGNILVPQSSAAAVTPQPAVLNTNINRLAVGDEHTSPVGLASELLGVEANFSQDFTEPTTRKEALPLPPQEGDKAVVAVDELCQAIFAANVKD